MNRSTAVVALIAAALTVTACRSAHHALAPELSSVVLERRCTATVDGVSNWKVVASDGFSFCVPPHWQYNSQFAKAQTFRNNQQYRMLSWGAPDSSQSIIVDVPNTSYAARSLQLTLANCSRLGRQVIEETVADKPVCVEYPLAGSQSPVDLTATFSDPLLRVRAKGVEESRRVVQTVRPLLPALSK